MPLSLAQLLEAPSVDDWKTATLSCLQGLGLVIESGTGGGNSPLGTGSLTLFGNPIGAFPLILVVITSSGELSTAGFKYSLDGGLTFTTGNTVPSSPGSFSLPGTGISCTFVPGIIGTGTSFVLGDTFAFAINTPSLPVTSWGPSGGYNQLVNFLAQALAKLSNQVAALASGGYPALATGSWCDLLGQYFYQLPRQGVGALAGFTKGLEVLTDSAGAGPFTIAAGAMSFASTGGLIYTNSTGGTLPKNGTLTLTIVAQQSGTIYNVGNNTIQSIIAGTLPGVTCTNPVGSGSWITSSGTDPESDSAYMLRCIQRWVTLGSGSPIASYQLWALQAQQAAGHPQTITKVLVQPNPVIAGQIDMYLASAAGGVDVSVVADVVAYITPRVALPATLHVQTASLAVITIAGNVFYYTSKNSLSKVQLAVSNALIAYFGLLGIGTNDATAPIISYTAIEAAIGSVLGGAGIAIQKITGLLTNGGTGDLTLTLPLVGTFTSSLSFTGV